MKLDIYKFDHMCFNESSCYQVMSGKRIINPGENWTNYINIYSRLKTKR